MMSRNVGPTALPNRMSLRRSRLVKEIRLGSFYSEDPIFDSEVSELGNQLVVVRSAERDQFR